MLQTTYGCCYYGCTLRDIASHPASFPLVEKEVNNLQGFNFTKKMERCNDLLCSLNGTDEKAKSKNLDGAIHFNPVYSHDHELEKLLRDAGGSASQIAFI